MLKSLGPPVLPFSPLFGGEGSPTKIDNTKSWYPYSNLSGGPSRLRCFLWEAFWFPFGGGFWMVRPEGNPISAWILRFPMCVLSIEDFKARGRLIQHEEARGQGLLYFFDDPDDVAITCEAWPKKMKPRAGEICAAPAGRSRRSWVLREVGWRQPADPGPLKGG